MDSKCGGCFCFVQGIPWSGLVWTGLDDGVLNTGRSSTAQHGGGGGSLCVHTRKWGVHPVICISIKLSKKKIGASKQKSESNCFVLPCSKKCI